MRSESARNKDRTKRVEDGVPVRSFRTLRGSRHTDAQHRAYRAQSSSQDPDHYCRRRPSTCGRRSSPSSGVTELRKLRMLEEENARLKRVVADLTLDRHILQEVLRKKV